MKTMQAETGVILLMDLPFILYLFKDGRYFEVITKSDELTQKWNDFENNVTT
jgi:hypothetical protein